MALLQEWREYAYSEEMQNSKEGQKLWENYFTLEKGIYEKLLANPSEIVEGTVQELADRYEVPLSMMVGFLDGINDSLKEANPIDEMEKDTQVKLDIDLEKLYYNMVNVRQNGFTHFHNGTIFCRKTSARSFIKSRRIPVRFIMRTVKSEEMIHVHVVPAKNISSAADAN